MSIHTLIDREPIAELRIPTSPHATNAAGLPRPGGYTTRPLRGLIYPASARQARAWLSLAIEADYRLVTTDTSVPNGSYIYCRGRLFRVTGARGEHYRKGTIPTHYSYPLLEVTP